MKMHKARCAAAPTLGLLPVKQIPTRYDHTEGAKTATFLGFPFTFTSKDSS